MENFIFCALKISAKNSLWKLKQGTYYTIFRGIQLVFMAYAVISNHLWECFEIKRT